MSSRLPEEVQLDIWENLPRSDADRALPLCKSFYKLFPANVHRLPARQIKLHFDDPLVGFQAWEVGVCRHTMRHRLYMLGRVLAGCVVQSVTVCNSTANDNQWNVGFDWFAAILRRYSEHFKVGCIFMPIGRDVFVPVSLLLLGRRSLPLPQR